MVLRVLAAIMLFELVVGGPPFAGNSTSYLLPTGRSHEVGLRDQMHAVDDTPGSGDERGYEQRAHDLDVLPHRR